MAFLIPDRTRVETLPGGQTVTVNEKIIPDSMVAPKDVASYVKKGQKMKPCFPLGGDGKPRAITIHNTGDIKVAAGTNAAEQYARATLNGNMGGVVVHYYVWHSDVWQLLAESERGWHAADGASRRTDHTGKQTGGNIDTIAIEVIGKDEESVETAKKLAAAICIRHGFDPAIHLYTHNYWMYGVDAMKTGVSKNCPVYILPTWPSFVADVVRLCKENAPEIGAIFSMTKADGDRAEAMLQQYGFSYRRWLQTE